MRLEFLVSCTVYWYLVQSVRNFVTLQTHMTETASVSRLSCAQWSSQSTTGCFQSTRIPLPTRTASQRCTTWCGMRIDGMSMRAVSPLQVRIECCCHRYFIIRPIVVLHVLNASKKKHWILSFRLRRRRNCLIPVIINFLLLTYQLIIYFLSLDWYFNF